MHLERSGTEAKGWNLGPWNSELRLAIGFANAGIDEPHLHTQITEIYLVGRGQAEIRLEQQTLMLRAGDVLVIEPGEAHTFLGSSPDYFHFVIHEPCLSPADKVIVERTRLGLDTR